MQNFFIYIAFLNLIFNPSSITLSLFAILIVYVVIALLKSEYILLFPFFAFPFMYLVRAQDPESLVLILLPEIFIIIACLFHAFKNGAMAGSPMITLYLMFYGTLTLVINMANVGNLGLFPILVRQYLLPILFLVAFINASLINPTLPIKAIRISILSFGIVSLIALLNIAEVINISPSNEALFPFLHYQIDGDNSQVFGRNLTDDIALPRINLFTGGALGSSAAIFEVLCFISFILSSGNSSLVLRVISVPLFVASFLTLSSSIVIAVFCISIVMVGSSKLKRYLLPFVIVIMLSVLNIKLFIDKSPLDYVMESSVGGFIEYIDSVSWLQILFGAGPRIVAKGYDFVPEFFAIDVGILRVFVETGIFNFIIFILFLLSALSRAYYLRNADRSYNGKPLLILLMLFILMVHANMTILPPFYTLFAAVIAGIWVEHRRFISNF